MDVNDILKLVNAGFTKEEIVQLNFTQKEQETTKSAPEPVVEEKVEVKEEAPQVTQPQTVTLSDEQLKQLIQGVAVKTTAGDIEVPPSLDDVMQDRITKLFS